jgi:hypothetical protein
LIKPVKEPINLYVFCDQVEGMPNYLRWDYTKYIGNDNKENTGDYPPLVFIKVFI